MGSSVRMSVSPSGRSLKKNVQLIQKKKRSSASVYVISRSKKCILYHA